MLFPSFFSFIFLSQLVYAATPHHHRKRSPGILDLVNSHSVQYSTNITIAGQFFQVAIDTTSSDLWVVSDPLPGATFKNEILGLQSLPGTATGNVMSAPVEFGGGSTAEQAFVLVSPDSIDILAGRGLLGVGSSSSSGVFSFFNNVTGNTVLDNLFIASTLADPFITIFLGRLGDPLALDFDGELTIAQTLPGWEAITKEPKLPLTTSSSVSVSTFGQQFQVLLDDNGFIGPDGKPIDVPFDSSLTNSPRPTVGFDSSRAFSQVAPSVAEAIYSPYGADAELRNVSEVDGAIWVVVCDVEVNVTLLFGGEAYPVHPLDATIDPLVLNFAALTLASGKKGCIGSFQPAALNTEFPIFDMFLAQPFRAPQRIHPPLLRKLSQRFTNKPDPYVQSMSTVNATQAHQDFVTQRLNGTDTTSTSTYNNYNSKVSSQLDIAHDWSSGSGSGGLPWKTAKIVIIALGAASGLLLVALIAAVVAWRRAKERGEARGSYQPVHLPGLDKAY
ncbi:aspartic peptidase domain-containing protein [Roridomyces roridus]|uniref:Aspartic peptidase domain-containing protein n=1 Tax=Roridomyces roridus TaxID=1738132 RepID=A0AAD7C0U9_9AGAR|nr:aspartic peptidase domain-containing protein [Roridomyces roridus]